MGKQPIQTEDRDPYAIAHCQRLTRQLHKGIITYEEYAPHVTDASIYAHGDDMQACLEQIPEELFPRYVEYLRAYLEPVDFMPEATQFLAGERTEERHDARRKELRPKYLRLIQLAQERLQAK